MNYSDALEVQVGLIGWLRSGGEITRRYKRADGSAHRLADYIIETKLLEAHTVYVSPDISRSLVGLAESFPAVPLTAAELPFANGFAYFAEPLDLSDPQWEVNAVELETDLRVRGLRALSWMPFSTNDFDGLVFDTWHDVEGVVLPRPSSTGRWEWGSSWNNFRGAHNAAGQVGTKYEPYKLSVRRLLHTLFVFMNQKIIVISATPAERHVRKRLARAGWEHEPLINIVELRRKERLTDHHAVPSVERDWSCRWWVRKHWRQQYYPSKHTTQPILIWPYVKGPDEKPLKSPRATVFAVVR